MILCSTQTLCCDFVLITLKRSGSLEKCKVHSNMTEFISHLFSVNNKHEPKLDVSYMLRPYVICVIVLTSNSLITFLSECSQRCQGECSRVCLKSCLSLAFIHSFAPARPQMHFFFFKHERSRNVAMQASSESCAPEPAPHLRPASGFTSLGATQALHAAPEQLFVPLCEEKQVVMFCQIRLCL